MAFLLKKLKRGQNTAATLYVLRRQRWALAVFSRLRARSQKCAGARRKRSTEKAKAQTAEEKSKNLCLSSLRRTSLEALF
jgi:hypothetical protein